MESLLKTKKKNITVSIFLLTYNQEKFIGQTIESLLEQKTDFRYQIVIGEDCSKDNTRKICEKYAEKYAEKIKLLPSKKNHGLIQNFIRTYKECDGRYVAICDGDDYWIDPLKLQKQVDFLDENFDYSIVFTSFKFLFPDGRLIEKDYSDQAEVTTFEDIILGNYICSATALFRNKTSTSDFPEWLDTCPYGDWPLYLWATKDGSKIKYLNDITAVYRKEIGVSEKMKLVPSTIAKENMQIVTSVLNDVNFIHRSSIVRESLKRHRFQLMGCYLREKQLKKLIPITLNNITFSPLDVFKIYIHILKANFKF